MSVIQKQWIISHYAKDELKGSELEYIESPVPDLADGDVLLKTLLLSLDPSNRLWLSEEKDYLPQLQIGDVMRGLVIAQVEASRHDNFKPGDILFTLQGWQEYAVVNGDELTPQAGTVALNRHPDIPLEAYVSALGLTGWTAYVGMQIIGEAKPSDTILVSGAAGATGMAACQIAKAQGARVIGIAGGQAKCDFLKQQLGLDDCIDYKACDDLSQAMAETCPQGVDVFFDNIGGAMLDAALENMNINGRLVISGSMSQYQHHGDKSKLYGVQNTFMLASKRLKMQGFLILDYLDQLASFLPVMEQWLLEGKLQYRNTVVEGLANAQSTLPQLFSGKNTGKLVITVAEPDSKLR